MATVEDKNGGQEFKRRRKEAKLLLCTHDEYSSYGLRTLAHFLTQKETEKVATTANKEETSASGDINKEKL